MGEPTLIERLAKAEAAYQNILETNRDMSPTGSAIAGAMVLAMHGHLFREARTALSRAGGDCD